MAGSCALYGKRDMLTLAFLRCDLSVCQTRVTSTWGVRPPSVFQSEVCPVALHPTPHQLPILAMRGSSSIGKANDLVEYISSFKSFQKRKSH
eukprot:scaffold683_cov124-Cylindrotheca_fusiformis.AAC.25